MVRNNTDAVGAQLSYQPKEARKARVSGGSIDSAGGITMKFLHSSILASVIAEGFLERFLAKLAKCR